MNIDNFENNILSIINNNDKLQLKEIMMCYTYIYKNTKESKEFVTIYKNIIKRLIDDIKIIKDKDKSIYYRNIQLELYKYYNKKKILDKIYFNFKYYDCNYISNNMFDEKFKDVPKEYLECDIIKIKKYITNCKNSLVLKNVLINDNEFFKRNIFCYL